MTDPRPDPVTRPRAVLVVVLALMFATGWAANHFTAMLPVLARSESLDRAVLDGAFGVYAVGLLPGLLGGGALSDRWGRRTPVLCGATVAGLGNLLLLGWHDEQGVFVGRLVVGAGVGLAMSAGTAWCADIGGGSGAVLAGLSLSAGFGCGPVVSGLLAQFAPAPTQVPFAVTAGLSALAVTFAVALTRSSTGPAAERPPDAAPAAAPPGTSVAAALTTALPLALWVFASATTAMVTMVERTEYRFSGPLLPGVAAAMTLGAGVLVQTVARARGWGPTAGVVGAVAASAGFGLVAAVGARPSPAAFVAVAILLGIGYGLCLRQGLLDIETLSPPRLRGALTGVFWSVTYLGFGLPVLLVTIEPAVGIVAPMVLLAALALATAAARGWRIRASPTAGELPETAADGAESSIVERR